MFSWETNCSGVRYSATGLQSMLVKHQCILNKMSLHGNAFGEILCRSVFENIMSKGFKSMILCFPLKPWLCIYQSVLVWNLWNIIGSDCVTVWFCVYVFLFKSHIYSVMCVRTSHQRRQLLKINHALHHKINFSKLQRIILSNGLSNIM